MSFIDTGLILDICQIILDYYKNDEEVKIEPYTIDHGFTMGYSSHRLWFQQYSLNRNFNIQIQSSQKYTFSCPIAIYECSPFPKGDFRYGSNCAFRSFQCTMSNLAMPWSKHVITAKDGITQLDYDVCVEFAKLRRLEFQFLVYLIRHYKEINYLMSGRSFNNIGKNLNAFLSNTSEEVKLNTPEVVAKNFLDRYKQYQYSMINYRLRNYNYKWTDELQEICKEDYVLNISRRVAHKNGTVFLDSIQEYDVPIDASYPYYNPPLFHNFPSNLPVDQIDLFLRNKENQFIHTISFKAYPNRNEITGESVFLTPIWEESQLISSMDIEYSDNTNNNTTTTTNNNNNTTTKTTNNINMDIN